jgi:hypothetical protein
MVRVTNKNKNYIFIVVLVAMCILCVLIFKKVRRDEYKLARSTGVPSQLLAPMEHPVLEYQRLVSAGQVPATLGDPIRPTTGASIGPLSQTYKAYGLGESYGWDQFRNNLLGVPVPRGALKISSEKYKYPFYYQQVPLAPYDYFKPYGPNTGFGELQKGLKLSDTPFYNRGVTMPVHELQIPGSQSQPLSQRFIGSVNSFAPFPEVESPWEKTGILTTVNKDDDSILNVYRRPIAPLQDLFRYMVQDKNGFLIRLKDGLLEQGDLVIVPGKESKGAWRFSDYTLNKYIWM